MLLLFLTYRFHFFPCVNLSTFFLAVFSIFLSFIKLQAWLPFSFFRSSFSLFPSLVNITFRLTVSPCFLSFKPSYITPVWSFPPHSVCFCLLIPFPFILLIVFQCSFSLRLFDLIILYRFSSFPSSCFFLSAMVRVTPTSSCSIFSLLSSLFPCMSLPSSVSSSVRPLHQFLCLIFPFTSVLYASFLSRRCIPPPAPPSAPSIFSGSHPLNAIHNSTLTSTPPCREGKNGAHSPSASLTPRKSLLLPASVLLRHCEALLGANW